MSRSGKFCEQISERCLMKTFGVLYSPQMASLVKLINRQIRSKIVPWDTSSPGADFN